MQHRDGEAGVTLLEILIVLVIVGAMAGMISLSVGGAGSASGLERAATLMASRLTLVAERAALTGEDAAIAWAPEGYRFLQYRDGAWQPHELPQMTAAARLGTLRLSGAESGASAVISADLVPSDARPMRWELTDGAARVSVVFDGLVARAEAVR